MHAETYISTRIDTFFYNEFDDLVGWCWISIFFWRKRRRGLNLDISVHVEVLINNSNLV